VTRVAIVLPLKDGARARARALLERGPRLGAEEAFLTDREVVFVYETATQPVDAQSLLGADWEALAAGPPSVGEEAYGSLHHAVSENVVFTPTPGPGDSDGGDIFPPGKRSL
jgi:hypothetical protein